MTRKSTKKNGSSVIPLDPVSSAVMGMKTMLNQTDDYDGGDRIIQPPGGDSVGYEAAGEAVQASEQSIVHAVQQDAHQYDHSNSAEGLQGGVAQHAHEAAHAAVTQALQSQAQALGNMGYHQPQPQAV